MSANPNGLRVAREVRVRQVRELREQGLPLREIAARLGIGTQMVHHYLSDPSGEKVRARKLKRHGACVDCGAKTFNSGSTPPKRCRSCHVEHERTLEYRRAAAERGTARVRWTDEEILDAIRSTARDGVASKTVYEEAYAAVPRGSMPSFALVAMRFGLRSHAVKAAGLTLSRRRGGPYANRLTREGALLAVEECAADLGQLPSYRQYQEWAQANGAPCEATVRLRCGTWMAAIEAIAGQAAA